ncbi:hypothetical protein GO986_20935 [Deinococcus sp. HMF7620]|uniref:DUF3618 domain-containing protein n=1 Tax=Deinococcus arboris TaxID=2682977 RepID=A0A7C9MTR8_9DEIO|nr:hypothetical protein [Deinococcus arboris]MVN89204.1 hypothetical protein [Deinococcus arboris]
MAPTDPTARVYLTDREEARERLKKSVDALTHEASLQVKMQQEPLKMLGGASAVGAVLGLVIGRQFRRSRKIYVDAASPVKHQKGLIKAQKNQKGSAAGGALMATIGTLAFKTLTDRVIAPRLESLADRLLTQAGQEKGASAPASQAPPTAATATRSYAQQAPAEGSAPPAPLPQTHAGQVPIPPSQVEAKAKGSEIAPSEMANPNRR